MPRYLLEVMYDGTAFNGSQLQGKLPTVQLALNQALSTLLRENVVTLGASRTDTDVHATKNFYHFDSNGPMKPSFVYNLNSILPEALAVREIYETAAPGFNARFDATSRLYRYRIYNRKDPFRFKKALYYPFVADAQILTETAAIVKEYTNFETFSKRNTQSRTYECRIHTSYWEPANGELHYVVQANRFLRGMVRALVGTQLLVARGKMTVDEFRSAIEARDCSRADFSVAGYGLYLEDIIYPKDSFTRVIFSNDSSNR